ncbi:MAG: 16S rRNA (cytosine(1402)-N(4))-methyltransferase, partial [candidate division WOR-3 bacterium]
QTGKQRSALDLLRRVSEQELRSLLRAYGEEPMSGRIARVVHEARGRIRTTQDLAGAIRQVLPGRFVRRALPRVFQALRIAVNDELRAVRMGLDAALDVLVRGGRLVTICYHSLEARLVKQAFGSASTRLRVLTRKAVAPGSDEVRRNPRARSARLRAAEVVG